MAFTAEFLLFYFHSTNHHGLEGRYHEILVLLIGLCIVCALLSAAYPENFAADMLSGIALTLQGAWFYMIAFTLYGPLMPDGCSDVRDEIVCIGDSFEVRGEAVAHIQLAALVPCLWVLILVAYGLAAHFWGHPDVFHPPSSEITDFRSGPLDSPMSAEHWLTSGILSCFMWLNSTKLRRGPFESNLHRLFPTFGLIHSHLFAQTEFPIPEQNLLSVDDAGCNHHLCKVSIL